jgi:hypothetical protein
MADIVRPQRCATCKFGVMSNIPNQLECRRNPPFTTTLVKPDGGLHKDVSFAFTFPDLWCGEWKFKVAVAQAVG